MKTTDFDILAASGPVDKVAARVTGTKKPEYEYETHNKHWKAPPAEMRPIPDNLNYRGLKRGDVFGRFTVVGLWYKQVRKTGAPARAKYVVRCTCGDYEIRTAYDMKRNKARIHHQNACFNCMRWESVKSAF